MQYNPQYPSNALSELFNKYYYADGGEVNSQDDQGFANGGLVGTPPTMYDPMKVDDIVASIDAPHNY